MEKKHTNVRKPSSYYEHNIWKTQQLFENHLGSLIGANAASSGCVVVFEGMTSGASPLVEGISGRIPWVPPTSQAITPWQEPPSVQGN